MKHGKSPTTDPRLKRGRLTQYLHVSTDPEGKLKGRSFNKAKGDLTLPMMRALGLARLAAEPAQPAETFSDEHACATPDEGSVTNEPVV